MCASACDECFARERCTSREEGVQESVACETQPLAWYLRAILVSRALIKQQTILFSVSVWSFFFKIVFFFFKKSLPLSSASEKCKGEIKNQESREEAREALLMGV